MSKPIPPGAEEGICKGCGKRVLWVVNRDSHEEIDKLRAENAAIQRANKELNRLIDDEIRGRMGPA